MLTEKPAQPQRQSRAVAPWRKLGLIIRPSGTHDWMGPIRRVVRNTPSDPCWA